MSDEIALSNEEAPPEVPPDDGPAIDGPSVDAPPSKAGMTTEGTELVEGEITPTDDLSSLSEVHAVAEHNRQTMGPAAADPTIPSPGTEFPPEPGPGPEDNAKLDNATAGALSNAAGKMTPSQLQGTTPEAQAELEAAGVPRGDEGGTEEYEEVEQVESDYDPSSHTVNEVNEYIADHPEEADAIYAAEQSGKNRAGIVG